MLALERRNLILEKLQTERRVVVSELSQLYEVSEETIRRDLDKLEKEGLATKSYGGAVINENVSIDLPFNIRKNQNVGGKQKMAEIVAEMVQDGDHIFLDASTTAVFIAKALKDKERLTVITNSMEILIELSDVSGWNIISTGGVMKEGYLAFLGSRTEEVIRSYYVDKVFFSCKALDQEWGIMESQEAFEKIREGDRISVDLEQGQIVNETTGESWSFQPMPEFVREICDKGGLYEYIQERLLKEGQNR